MGVTVSAVSSNIQDNTSVSTGDTTNFTVASGEAVVGLLMVRNSGVTGMTAVWDPAGSNESLTQVTSIVVNSGLMLFAFAKLNPTAGASKFIRFSWTGAGAYGANGLALAGMDTGSVGTTFVVATATSGNSGTSSITITSATDDLTLDFVAVDSAASVFSVPTQTQRVLNNAMTSQAFAASTAVGAASNTHQWTVSAAGPWGAIGLNIIRAGGVGGGGSPSPVIVGKRFRGLIYS